MRKSCILACVLFAVAPAFAHAGDLKGALPSVAGQVFPDQPLDFGFGLQVDDPYPSPGGPLQATVFFFNRSDRDAPGNYADFGGVGCRFDLVVRNAKGRIVWRPNNPCPLGEPGTGAAPAGPFPFPAGTTLVYPVPLTMVYRASDTLDPDGEPLPGGPYMLEANHDYDGPKLPDPEVFAPGGVPAARVPFRVVHCESPGTQPVPRQLGSGRVSGYRYGDPSFSGEDIVLRSEQAALAFYAAHASLISPPPPPPTVNFDEEMVLVTLLGYQPTTGPRIQILSVEEHSCHLLVNVTDDRRPGHLPAVSNPFDAVAVPRTLKEVVFVHSSVN